MQKHSCRDRDYISKQYDYASIASPFAIVGSLLSFSGLCYRNSSGLPIFQAFPQSITLNIDSNGRLRLKLSFNTCCFKSCFLTQEKQQGELSDIKNHSIRPLLSTELRQANCLEVHQLANARLSLVLTYFVFQKAKLQICGNCTPMTAG